MTQSLEAAIAAALGIAADPGAKIEAHEKRTARARRELLKHVAEPAADPDQPVALGSPELSSHLSKDTAPGTTAHLIATVQRAIEGRSAR